MTASEKIATTLDNLVRSNVSDMKTFMKELFATGRLHKKLTPTLRRACFYL